MPPIAHIADPHDAWKAQLDHFRAHMETQRIGVERFKAQVDQEKMLIEARKLAFEANKLRRQWYLDSAKAVYDYGRYAINCVLILNGGAALAVMQHLGSARDVAARMPLPLLGVPLMVFAGGLASAALAAATAYLAQSAFTGDWDRTGTAFQITAITCWFASLGCFLCAATLLARSMLGA